MKHLLFTLCLINLTYYTYAQDTASQETIKADSSRIDLSSDLSEDIPTIELNPGAEEEEIVKRKVKKKRNTFWNVKAKKRFTKVTKGRNTTYELFFTLKEYENPNKYCATKFYYDHEKKSIVKSRDVNPKLGMPLHGTYVKIINQDTLVTGQFYKGVRTGRWISYRSDGLISDKKYYYMGHPKESEISYYDADHKKVKEVIPFQHGVKDGTYMKYYPSGRLMVIGVYKDDVKTGRWIEYYDRSGRRNRKKEMQYRKDVFDDKFVPYVIREWNEKGKSIFDRSREKRN